MNIIEIAKNRHTSKSYNNNKISDADIIKIKELLQLSPSSTNLQPWHFFIASSDEAKQKILKSTDEKYPFNSHQIKKASHVIVFCVKNDIDESYLAEVLAKEEQDGRFIDNPNFKSQMQAGRALFVDLNRNTFKDLKGWLEKQVYINLGFFLLGVKALGFDATAMEGFEKDVLDKELNLEDKGLSSLIVVPIGFSDVENDYNAKLPKSRLSSQKIITDL